MATILNKGVPGLAIDALDVMRKKDDELTRLRKEVETLREALAPLADYPLDDDLPDHFPLTGWLQGRPPAHDDKSIIRARHVRAACVALQALASKE